LIKIAHMAMDSIERAFDKTEGHKLPEALTQAMMQRVGQGGEMVVNNMTRWVFYGGLENAWNHVPSVRS
jgi:oxidoreductase AflY